MKRGFVVFLILITVGAIFSGTTVVFYNNFPRLVEIWNEEARMYKKETQEKEKQKQLANNLLTAPIEMPAPPPYGNAPIVVSSLFTKDSSQTLTRSEQEQIVAMLKALGVTAESYSNALKVYQTKKSLVANGVLTIETLEAIVRDFTVARVNYT